MTVNLPDSAYAGPPMAMSCDQLNPEYAPEFRSGQQRAKCNRVSGHKGHHQYIDPRDFRVVLEWML